MLDRVNRNEVRILVGTQMLTKGHDFPNVTLVVVLNADQGLFSTDFAPASGWRKPSCRSRVARVARSAPGEVLIQTEYPDHPLLTLLLTGGYEAFATGALTEREQSGWPPFARIALLRAEASAPGAPCIFCRRRARPLNAIRVATSGCSARRPRPWSAARAATARNSCCTQPHIRRCRNS